MAETHRIGFVRAIRMADVLQGLKPVDIGARPVRLPTMASYALELGVRTDSEDEWEEHLWEMWEDYLGIKENLDRVSAMIRPMHPSDEPFDFGKEREQLSLAEMQYRYRSLVAGYRYKLLNFETKAEELERSRIVWEARQRFIEAANWVELKD